LHGSYKVSMGTELPNVNSINKFLRLVESEADLTVDRLRRRGPDTAIYISESLSVAESHVLFK
jgi:hypothetical protein